MEQLRAPGGCPWDREQTHESLKPHLIEEAYEVLHALDADDDEELREELGDLLLQIVFHAQLAREEGRFDMQGVIDSIHAKIVRRHPHVFGDVKVRDSREVLDNWDRIKQEERREKRKTRDSLLDGLPPGLPALYEAYQMGVRAARAGFDWNEARQVLPKIREELDELEAILAGPDRAAIRAEAGDILFAVVNLCRKLSIDPETTLKNTNQKFKRRFHYIEKKLEASGRNIQECPIEDLEIIWQESKQWEN
ncbi:MAG: nucleoside triphosphate pyrophosphohydrolase [Acidobacteria bacterium]|nr:nucleoside triphosphate pyrophosphohydrolase [Acidobacteriota bacterium]